jgi:hypothetical protein
LGLLLTITFSLWTVREYQNRILSESMNADPEMQEKTKHVKYEEGVEWMKTYLSVTKTF